MFFLPLLAWDSAVFFWPLLAWDAAVFFLPLVEPLAAWDSAVFFLPPQEPLAACDAVVFFFPPDDPLAACDSEVFQLATVAAWIPSAVRFCNRFINVARNCACHRRMVGGGTSLCNLMNSASGKSMSLSKHRCNSCSQQFDMVRNRR